ncbi:hypothetical protein [Corynebacterium sp. HS2168-gen11]|uniref:hypothetical protein n=1 Tax=Corynebacterium sp. HS2168-gen11 TaxID=2974027 RepID=UPI00216AB55F|nr:hypothetical protein [Corynebacterium sp. HS2168-gen11]MCS4536474.1 hypothetical protein [Corynebacterium sp. HS2168-gen11]
MSQHTNQTVSNRMLSTTVIIATVLAVSTAVPAEASTVVTNSLQQGSVVSALGNALTAIGVFLFIIAGIINNTLVRRLGFKLTEVVGLPSL